MGRVLNSEFYKVIIMVTPCVKKMHILVDMQMGCLISSQIQAILINM